MHLNEGWRNKDIAQELNISEATVKWHLGNMFKKLKVDNRTQAMALLRGSDLPNAVSPTS